MAGIAHQESYPDRLAGAGIVTVLLAFILAAVCHLMFYGFARTVVITDLQRPDIAIPAPTFKLDRAEIDAGLLDEPAEPRPLPKPLDSITDFKLPDETVGFEDGASEIRATPAVTKIESPIFSESPKLAEPKFDQAIQDLKAGSTRPSEANIDALEKQLLAENDPMRPNAQAPKLLDPAQLGRQVPTDGDMLAKSMEGQGGSVGPGNFSNLDQLLNAAGPVPKGTAPILMPTDLLFDYNEYLMRQDAVSSLRKLGTLIQRNPQSSFLIEGHTDSFGPDDYNLWLSHQRALAVKDWLVRTMNIDPKRIETVGLGKRRLLVPPDRDVAAQQLNRRVEIVIRTKR
jgi:outer membrane protein OmpA-like peptidoglycan-associated protein